jgi:hypothetical protein
LDREDINNESEESQGAGSAMETDSSEELE